MSVPSVSTRALAGILVASAIVAAGLLVSPSTALTRLESVAADPFLFGAVVAGLYLVRPLFAWPTTPLAVVAGYGYGVTLGVPIALAGVVVTVVPVFFAARWFAPDPDEPVDRSSGLAAARWGSMDGIGEVITRYYRTAGPIRGVTASRLAPIPSDVSTCAAAASGVRLRHLVVGTAAGELPWTVAAVFVGASAATVTMDGLEELGIALSVACVLAAALLLAGPAYRVARSRSRTRRSARSTDG
ncbi:TVP38/TMEM64 family protein [Natrarchaeobius chitinivorans]|uniref:TVP38/TMEM64 family protein n=1 Tax=Natrarchaeobius chitinivorans TaxID=1679083 RepID=A0A3N6LSW5_NATCH|nr:VTT domain-containing protein [Natrarchaeobius chitinivorans]RQG90444.1 TVP38/TMEM64 family protein [Natrarchaeobius chitinivorans]